MKKYRYFLILLIVIIHSLRMQCHAQVLNVPQVIQEQTNWCWDASSKCILDYFTFTNAECTIAEYTRTVATWHNYGSVNCCTDPTQGCNYSNYNTGTPGSIDDILIHFGNLHTVPIATYLSMPEIQTEINASRPFIFRWGWYSGGGHFLVGHGISGTDLYYMNPLPGYGFEIANYSWVVDDGTSHTWTHTQTLCGPSIPGTISGNTSVCQGSAQTYSVSAVSGATSYTWTLPSGWSGSSTTTSITTSAGSAGGTISVLANNYCGSSMASTLSVSIVSTPTQPGTITGNATPCEGSSQLFSISPVSGASSYTWTLPSGWSGSSTSTSITATVGNNSGLISAAANNSCGSGAASTLNVSVSNLPVQPGSISGNTSPCLGSTETYSISAVNGATSYTWTLPSGWSGSSTSTSIIATVGANSSLISVTANNSCGSSAANTLNVSVSGILTQPGTIAGNASPCNGSTESYSISNVPGASSYTWTLPGDWIGYSSTNSIIATVGANSGTISVIANNSCGSSNASNLDASVVEVPLQPGTISGNAYPCQGATETYSISDVPGASSYTWTLPGDWTGNSSSKSIIATVGANSGTISVIANNSCGSSSTSTFEVAVIVGIANYQVPKIRVYPVPNDGIFTVEISSQKTETWRIEVYNNLGIRILEQIHPVENGSLKDIIDLGNVASGIYTIAVTNDHVKFIEHILILW